MHTGETQPITGDTKDLDSRWKLEENFPKFEDGNKLKRNKKTSTFGVMRLHYREFYIQNIQNMGLWRLYQFTLMGLI